VLPGFLHAPDEDVRSVRRRRKASQEVREQAVALLKAVRPRAVTDRERCPGDGAVMGSPCGTCAGLGKRLAG
jgi:hypothetical protein